MKIRNFFALILASVILVACNDETDDNGGIVTDPTGTAWISLSVKTTESGNGLRSLNGQEPGTLEESTVVNVRAMFFDTNDDLVTDLPLTPAQAGNPGEPTGGAGEPFQIDAASKRVMIIVNPASSFPSFAVGDNIGKVNEAIAASADNLSVTSTGFMMTNAKGDLEPSEDNGSLKALTLYKTKALAASNPPLTIKVDRLVAKVRLYAAGAAAASAPNAVVSNIGWVLNVTNKKYFPMSERVQTAREVLDPNHLTPFDQYKLGSYRKDPNYDHSVGPITYGDPSYADNYIYFDSNTSPLPTFANPLDDATSAGDPEYCLENTQRQEDNNFEFTTQILVKAQYLPGTYQTFGGGSMNNDPADGGDWMQISGAAYTYASLMTYVRREMVYKYASSNPATYSTPRADALNAYMNTIGVGAVGMPVPGDSTTVINGFLAKKAAIQAVATRGGTYGTFAYYADGINYYKIAVKHDNDDSDTFKNQLGEFGVVRNSVYDVKITKFNNPGYPAIPDPTPDPVDSDDSWLSVQIDINPWTWYVQEEEL